MAQSGFSPIQLYRSATLSAVPVAGNLVFGELALNYRDGNLFFKDSSNVVRLLASTAAATGTVSSVQASGGTTGLTFTGGPITTSGTLTLGGTLGVANGGTGAGDAATARTNLGAGTVSSVQVSGGTTGLTATGGPITTSGTLTLGGTLAVANGGTGATAAPAARTNLGATTLGANLFTITNPSAITFPRFNADNTVSALSAADFRTAIGVGTGTGTVTSVGGTGTVNGLTLTGTVTTSGNLTLGGTLSGVSLTSAVTGVLPVANGGTGVTSSTGTGSVVLSTAPSVTSITISAPAVGGTVGNASVPYEVTTAAGPNTLRNFLVNERVTAGSDWTTTRSRLVSRIDVTDQTYIDLRTEGLASAIAFGTGGPGAVVERMRITQGGDVGIGASLPGATGIAPFVAIGANNAGIGSVSANNIAIVTANAERMRISAGGNVGIGTTNPGVRLDVVGPALTPATQNTYALWVANSGGANGDLAMGSNASAAFIQSFGAKPLYVNSVGNAVVVGGTPAAVYSGFTSVTDIAIQQPQPLLNFVSVNGATRFGYIYHNGAGGNLDILNQQNGAITFGANNVERARISAAGDVGIGTNNPQGRFHVTGGPVRFGPDSGTGGVLAAYSDGNSATIEAFAANNAATKRDIGLATYGGNVGIGTTNPQARLHVAGGDIRLDNTFSLTFRNPANTANARFVYQGDDNFVAYNAANVPIWNFTGGASPNASYGCNANTRAIFDASTNNINFRTNGTDKLIINVDGDITSSNRAAAVGFKGVPPSGITSGTITTADIGRCVPATAGVTAPSGTFARGDTITIYNDSASAITITQGAGLTLRLAGTTTTGNRTLAARGMATLWYNSASEAIASGPGLT